MIKKKTVSRRINPRRAGNKQVKRSRRRRNLAQNVNRVLGKIFVLAVLLGVFYLGYLFFLKSERFMVKEVIVTGNQHARTDEIKNIAEAQKPMNVFLVRFSDLKERIKSLNWIESLAISSEIPDTLVIRVKEKIPIALGVYEDEIYLLDRYGTRIDKFIPDFFSFHLPLINGLGDSEDTNYFVRMRQGLEVAKLLVDPEIQLLEEISEIDISAAHNVRLLKEPKNTEIFLGQTAFREKLLRYKNLKNYIESNYLEIDYIDLRFNRRVIIHPSIESG